MLALILDGRTAIDGARQGIELCLRTVIPSLFPFFVLSILLTSSLLGGSLAVLRPLGRLFGMPDGAESLLIPAFLGGYPGAVIENDFGWAKLHPVVEGYKNYHKMPYDRASWDLLSVVYLLHPEYFTESEPGTVAVDDKGFTNFSPGPDGRHRWLTATPEQLTRLRDCIVRTTTRAPKHTEL